MGRVNNIPTMQFLAGFTEICNQNLIHYRRLSAPVKTETLYCGILFNMMLYMYMYLLSFKLLFYKILMVLE